MLVFGGWYYFRYQDYPTWSQAVQVTLLKVGDIALMIYITNYLLIPRLLYKKKYGLFVLVFVVMILTSSILKMYIIGEILGRPDLFRLNSHTLKTRLYDNIIPHFFLVIAGAAVKLIFDFLKMQQRVTEIAKEKAETELNFLKSQINPHFLFNSLNSVYFLIHKDNPAARQALHKFSDMLRYQLYEMNGEKIPIEKEITYLKDYMDLQQLRKDDRFEVRFDCSPDVKGFLIEPLLLIPFVENAFKHISNKDDSTNFVTVKMSRQNGSFAFEVENSRDPGIKNTEQAGGIGLNNVKRRLELLYPQKHELSINDTPNVYKIDLKLNVDQ
jgi:sensor histidine kinase YesM